jgi:SapC protein
MARLVQLDNVEHARLRLTGLAGSELSSNQAQVVPNEFEQLQREYPILFQKDAEGNFQSIAILGLDRGENLFAPEGQWETRYVPAAMRRGPFFLGVDDDARADPAIVIDLDDPRVSESDGDPIFLAQGGAAPFLQQAAESLRIVHEGLKLSRAMFDLFAELDFLAPVDIDVDLGDGIHYRLTGQFTIGAEQLASLSGGALERLNRSGFLACAIHARSSLANISRLIELKLSKLAGGAAHG